MEKEDFQKISITQIVSVAGVGRSSFYRNFESKEELLCDYIMNLYKNYFNQYNIPNIKSEVDCIEKFLQPRFNFIYTNRNIFKLLHKNDLLYYFFKKIEGDFLLTLCGQKYELSTYYTAMFAGSCASVIRHWIEKDFVDSVDEMTKLFKKPPKLM